MRVKVSFYFIKYLD